MFPSMDKPLVVIPDVNKDLLEIDDDDVIIKLSPFMFYITMIFECFIFALFNIIHLFILQF